MRALGLSLALLAVLAALCGPASARDILVRGGTVLTGTGEVIEGGSVLLKGGKVEAVGKDLRADEGALVIDATGKFVCPGFVDAYSHLGLRPGELDETVLPISLDTSPLSAFDPACSAVAESLAAGVTTALVAPGTANPLAGPCAAVKLGDGSALSRAATVSISLSLEALLADRRPTSLPVLLEMLRATLTEAKSGDAAAPLTRAVNGTLPVSLCCDGASSIEQAVALAREFGLHGAVLVPSLPLATPKLLAGTGLAGLLPPLTLTPADRHLTMAARLSAAKVPFAFTSMAVGDRPSDVRTSAALAAGAGLPREEALRALTLGAAEVLGIADRVGSLEKGKDGDLLVIGGSPLSLAAPIEYVIVDGSVAYERGKR